MQVFLAPHTAVAAAAAAPLCLFFKSSPITSHQSQLSSLAHAGNPVAHLDGNAVAALAVELGVVRHAKSLAVPERQRH